MKIIKSEAGVGILQVVVIAGLLSLAVLAQMRNASFLSSVNQTYNVRQQLKQEMKRALQNFDINGCTTTLEGIEIAELQARSFVGENPNPYLIQRLLKSVSLPKNSVSGGVPTVEEACNGLSNSTLDFRNPNESYHQFCLRIGKLNHGRLGEILKGCSDKDPSSTQINTVAFPFSQQRFIASCATHVSSYRDYQSNRYVEEAFVSREISNSDAKTNFGPFQFEGVKLANLAEDTQAMNRESEEVRAIYKHYVVDAILMLSDRRKVLGSISEDSSKSILNKGFKIKIKTYDPPGVEPERIVTCYPNIGKDLVVDSACESMNGRMRGTRCAPRPVRWAGIRLQNPSATTQNWITSTAEPGYFIDRYQQIHFRGKVRCYQATTCDFRIYLDDPVGGTFDWWSGALTDFTTGLGFDNGHDDNHYNHTTYQNSAKITGGPITGLQILLGSGQTIDLANKIYKVNGDGRTMVQELEEQL